MSDSQTKAEEVKRKFEGEWLRLKGVSAVGLGRVDSGIGIIISVETQEHKIRTQVPAEIEGVPIKIEISGALKAQ